MGDPVNMVQDGKVYAVPAEQVEAARQQGYVPETEAGHTQRLVSDVRNDVYGGAGGKVAAAGAGLLRGATLGTSDAVLGALGGGDDLDALRQENPNISIGAEILGGLSPVGPAGYLSKAGKAVAGLGEGAGIVGRTAYSAGGAALEGAGQSGGQYLSSVALEDKPLSAEGFVGAMGKGALFAAPIGGGLSLAESTLMRAKALFPRAEVTREATKAVEADAQSAMSSVATDGKAMQSAARQRLEELRIQRAEQQLAIDKRVGDAQAARAEALAARAKNPPTRTRKTFEEPAAPTASTPDASMPETATTAASSPAPGGDDLLSQLQGTKAALDSGASIGEVGADARAGSGRDARGRNAAYKDVAAENPEAAKLVDAASAHDEALSAYEQWLGKYGKGGNVERFERGQAAREYAAGMKPKESGYYSSVPSGEGNIGLARGRQWEFRGSEADRAAAEAETMVKLHPEEQVAADQAVAEMAARRRAKPIGEAVLDTAAETGKTIDDHIGEALKPHVGEHIDLGPNLDEAAKVIGKVESTGADLAEALGPAAPGAATERAQAYRGATAAKAESDGAAAASTADDIATKLTPEVARRTGGEGVGEIATKLGDLGAGMEVLKAMGIGVPDVSSIPVIGPVLSLYLKARAALGVFRRAGGSVSKTAEGVIAAKQAVTRNRMNAAVVGMLDVGAKAARTAQKVAGPTGALAARLFPSPGSKPGKDDTRGMYQARMDELARAAQPGAVMQAVKDHVQTSDPMLQQQIADTLGRKLSFISSKAPRQPTMPTMLKGDGEWHPSKPQLDSWAKYVQAAEDPASVLEDVARGKGVSIEAAETLRTVYPSLYREAQMLLVQRAPQMQETLPYTRRVTLSVLFQVPVDGTMSPDHLAFLQQGTKPAAPPTAPQGMPAPGTQPIPTVAGSVALGDRTMTALDRRAGA